MELIHQPETLAMEVVSPSVVELIERAQTDVQISTAKKYPRPDLSVIKKRMVSEATADIETAQACFYVLRRGKGADAKEIRGPSIRLAEIAWTAYGNLRAGATIIDNDGKMITARGICHDLQNNVFISIDVKRRITDKYGKTFSEDMQVVTGTAACSIALRNAIFKVIPGALINQVYNQAVKAAIGDAKTLSQRRNDAFAAFEKLGVSADRVLNTLGRTNKEDVTLEDLETLIGLHTAIREGLQDIDEAFPEKPKVKAPDFQSAQSTQSSPDPTKEQPTQAKQEKQNQPAEHPTTEASPYETLKELMARDGITDEQLTAFCIERKLAKPGQTWSDLATSKLNGMIQNWDQGVKMIKGI